MPLKDPVGPFLVGGLYIDAGLVPAERFHYFIAEMQVLFMLALKPFVTGLESSIACSMGGGLS